MLTWQLIFLKKILKGHNSKSDKYFKKLKSVYVSLNNKTMILNKCISIKK